MSLVKNAVWEKLDSLGNSLSEEKIMKVDVNRNKVTIKSMPLNPIDIDDFKSAHRFVRHEKEDHSGLSDLLGGFSHLKNKPKKAEVSKSNSYSENLKEVKQVVLPPKEIVEIEPKIKSVLDLTKDSLLDGDVEPSLKLLKMFEIRIEDFVSGLVVYEPTKPIISILLIGYLTAIDS